eukprot:491741-Prorocentrum_minimum.AAC.1
MLGMHAGTPSSPESTPSSPASTPSSPESTPFSPELTPFSPELTPSSHELTPLQVEEAAKQAALDNSLSLKRAALPVEPEAGAEGVLTLLVRPLEPAP